MFKNCDLFFDFIRSRKANLAADIASSLRLDVMFKSNQTGTFLEC